MPPEDTSKEGLRFVPAVRAARGLSAGSGGAYLVPWYNVVQPCEALMDFSGKVVWITGASSGIGAALARALGSRGARVVLSARRADALEAVRASCSRPETHYVAPLDLAASGTFADLARHVLDTVGPIDMLVNNGGISQRGSVVETDLSVVRRIMEVNFFGTVALTQAVLPSMLARRTGHIVVVSSLMGKFATPRRSTYAASKHALHGFFDALRAEVWEAGIRVTVVCPGYVRTDISRHALTAVGTPYARMDPGQERGMPPEACAERILRAVQKGKHEVLIGGKETGGAYLKRFFPGLLNRVIRRVPVT